MLLDCFLTMYFNFLLTALNMAAFYANGVMFYLINSSGDFSFSKSTTIGISFGVFPICVIVLVLVLLSMCLLIKWFVIGDFQKMQSRGLIAVDSWHSFKWCICNFIVHGASTFPMMLLDEFWLTATFWKDGSEDWDKYVDRSKCTHL